MIAETFQPGVFVDGIRFVGDNPGLIVEKTLEHLELSVIAIVIALLIGLPVGVVLGHLHRGSFLAINLGNVGRALPSLAVVAFGLAIFGIGMWNVVFALVVLAVPLIVTNAFVAVDGVDPDAVESARGMGMSPRQVLWRVELPLALPLLFAGVRTGVALRDRDGDPRGHRRRRRPRRHHRQPGQLPVRRRDRGGPLRVGARVHRGRPPRRRPARDDAAGTARADALVGTGYQHEARCGLGSAAASLQRKEFRP